MNWKVVEEVEMDRVILDERDADKLLRLLYNGQKPARVHTVICLCGAMADLRVSPCAWNGWRLLPTAVCPMCLLRTCSAPCLELVTPIGARERFLEGIQAINSESEKEG